MNLNSEILILPERTKTTLGELLKNNDFTTEEKNDITHALDNGQSYRGGGGATPQWEIIIILNRTRTPVKTIEELIDLVSFGDTDEVAYSFNDDPECPEYSVRLPYKRPEELKPGGCGLSEKELEHYNFLAILIAYKEKRLGKGGHVLINPWKD